MDSAEAVAAKRRVLVDALMMCLQKSRVVEFVDAATVRSVLDSASGELWRQGEFRLDPVWKILVSQPGLTAEEVAPPLLVFKAYENELGVQVRVPQALSAIPRGEQVRLRDTLGIEREDFTRAIDEMRALAEAEQRGKAMQDLVSAAAGKRAEKEEKPRRQPKKLAIGLALFAFVALDFSLWLALRDPSKELDLTDARAIVQLSNGRAAGKSLTATIVDPKWNGLSVEEREKLAERLLDLEMGKGIRSIVLLDQAGGTRALISETPGGRNIVIQ